MEYIKYVKNKRQLFSVDALFKEIKLYRYFTKKLFYPFDNRITNKYGSISMSDISIIDTDLILFSACLFTENKERSDRIINQIKKVKTKLTDTRSYPTGIFMEGNYMIIGEAPSYKGTAIKKDWMKPTFYATDSSYFIRYFIKKMFLENQHCVPYITNVLKSAMPGNDVKTKDLKRDIGILKKEIEWIYPKKIIALGNKVYDFLQKSKTLREMKISLVKMTHPSFCLYKNLTKEQYLKRCWGELNGKNFFG